MRGRKIKFLVMFLVIGISLIFSANIVFALEKDEMEQLKTEIDKLAKEDPELAGAMREEFRDAVEKGEIDMHDKGEMDRGQHRDSGPDPDKVEKEFQDLIKSGMSSQEADRVLIEKYGEPPEKFDKPDITTPEGKQEALEKLAEEKEFMLKEGFTEQDLKEIEDKISKGEDPREIFEKHMDMDFDKGPGDFERGRGDFDRPGFDRGGPDREWTKEEMEKEFMREMGREPTESEREMMERGGPEREMGERGDFEREMMERGEFEREMGEKEREMMEREFEREGFERDFERDFERERDERIKEDEFPPPPQE